MKMEHEFYRRLNLQHIRDFIICGTEAVEVNSDSYEERIEKAHVVISDLLHEYFPDESEYEKIMVPVYGYVTAVQDVFMEIGMQCGASLLIQLLSSNDLYRLKGFMD